jgi:hypothetical protein
MVGFCRDRLDAGHELLARETGATQFRWIDIGVSTLAPRKMPIPPISWISAAGAALCPS